MDTAVDMAELAIDGSPPANDAGGSRYASFGDIISANDLGETDVDVREWGLTVRVRGITREEFRTIERMSETKTGETDPDLADLHLLHIGMVSPKVSIDEAEQLLKTKSINSVQTITLAIMEASGMGDAFQ